VTTARKTGALPRRRAWRLLPLLVLIGGFGATAWLVAMASSSAGRHDTERLHRLSDDAAGMVRARLAVYSDALLGGAGLLAASDQVTSDEWRVFVESLDLTGRYPGINGMGVIFPVPAAELEEFEAVRGAELPGFGVHAVPGFTGGNLHYVVTYLEPLEPNRKALGLDMASEPNRRTAAELARDTGEAQVTGRIVLVTDEQSRAGFLLFVPVYRPASPLTTVEERRAAFAGWVYAPFVTEEFLAGVLDSLNGEIDIHVYQQVAEDSREALYHTLAGEAPDHQHDHLETRPVSLAGQLLMLEISRGPEFQAAGRRTQGIILVGGLIVSALLVILVSKLQGAGRAAQQLAERRTRELKVALAFQKGILDGAGNAVVATDINGIVMLFNPAAEALLGYSAGEVVGKHSPVLYHDPVEVRARAAELTIQLGRPIRAGFDACVARARTGVTDSREWTFIRKDGSRVPVSLTVTMLRDADGAPGGYLGIARDISAEKQAEEELRESETRFRAVFDLSLDMIATANAEGVLTQVNPAWEKSLGHPEDVFVGKTIWPLVHPEDLEAGIAGALPALQGKPVYDSRVRVRHADGRWRWLSFNLSPVSESGEAYLVARDVTKEVEAQREMEELLEVLRASTAAMAEQNAELDQLRDQAEYLANHDTLTGTLNRRAWFAAATATELTAIAIFDIDHFKSVNDTYGHPAGDTVLAEVARRLDAALPEDAHLGRLGGEEFAALFTGPIGEARTAAARCIEAVAATAIVLPTGETLQVTVSGGLASWRPGLHSREESLAATYEAADRALYEAKHTGRHRLVVDRAAAA
jgi:diguanylate cyclase (GGDEF)-like protein/PAS domain S-box-containing protein